MSLSPICHVYLRKLLSSIYPCHTMTENGVWATFKSFYCGMYRNLDQLLLSPVDK